jgi:hypothetical protein
MRLPMENKDKVIKVLAFFLLVMIGVAMYQRTEYEDEIDLLKYKISVDSVKLKTFQDAHND